ncbi:MAG TPA: hypothetical protein VNB91_13685 [Jatrophihabitantaceae bacterium]|jgi:hypothetical protein|nr:hypothetical protein [Jatrophihabitantaceae bacterium]
MGAQWWPRWFGGFWNPRFPGQTGMVALTPDRVNRGVLWNSAKSYFSVLSRCESAIPVARATWPANYRSTRNTV